MDELRAEVHKAVDVLVDLLHAVAKEAEVDEPAADTATPETAVAPDQGATNTPPAEVETPVEDAGETEEVTPPEVANTPVGTAPVPPADPNVGNQPIPVL